MQERKSELQTSGMRDEMESPTNQKDVERVSEKYHWTHTCLVRSVLSEDWYPLDDPADDSSNKET